ncbi:type VII secretion protein EccCa [Actinoplanes sp. HUAS TT8]|uniref:type VII secretion protein EccCa n=1 Tax=Actinoplanes sp. HUAS TT8 TaxID=3447453 RepID=UPI003F51B1F3
MTTTLVKRPARTTPPGVRATEILIAEPPKPQAAQPMAASASMVIMPVISGAGSLLVAITNPGRPLFAAAGLLFLVASVALGGVMIFGQRSGPRRMLREARERYLDYVEDLRRQLRATVAAQKADGEWRHPDPSRLLDITRMDARRWERRAGDDDYLVLRAGLGDQPLATTLTMSADDGPLNEFDPVCLEAARQLRARYSSLRDQPVCVDLRGVGVLSVVGDRPAGRRLAGALAAQLIAFHSPEEVRLGVVRASARAADWEWLKWLPHAMHPSATDGDLPARLIASTVPAMAELIGAELEARFEEHQRHRGRRATQRNQLVIVVDGENLNGVWGLEPPERGVSLADLGIHLILLLGHRREEPEEVHARIVLDEQGQARQEWSGLDLRVDDPADGLLTSLARQCAPLRLVTEEASGALTGTVGLPEILGVPDVATLDPGVTWRSRIPRELLRVPIGVGGTGNAVMLDLKESAHGGMGPHGLIVGATGSGKSEMLRTLVTSLVIGHPPEQLALMLVDFKGGATFAPMAELPHIAGMVTNIEKDLTLVDRMRDALYGEMRRRQEILRAAGNLPNVTAYQALRDAGEPLDPLPHLLVIIDEFSELLTAKADFAELFVAIGRIGRSIGVHLLLATQRLETGKIRGLESHLSYRISLRTFSEAESREAIGVPDAYHLMPEPGVGYLKVDTTVFERFKAAMVSDVYTSPQDVPDVVVPVVPYLALNGLGRWLAAGIEATPASGPDGGRPAPAGRESVLDMVVRRLCLAEAPPTRPVWLPPLPVALPLDRIQEPAELAPAGTVSALLGLVDDPAAQRQFPLEWDFTGGGANLLVVGAVQSGKSTLLRTLVSSMALRYAPGDVAFYVIDYGGGSLGPLAELPHVAGVATRADPERITRTVLEVAAAVEAREELFRQHGFDSPAALREARTAGRIGAEVPGTILLVVDGWGSFREDFDLLEARVGEIAARGPNYGVYVLLSVGQTMQLRMRMQAAFGGRLELRLNDPFDSAFDRKAQGRLDKKMPGRGLIQGSLQFHVALPRVDGVAATTELGAAQRELVALARHRWPRGAVSPVQVLPTRVLQSELPLVDPERGLVPIGISERRLQPAAVDLTRGDPHLLVYGDGETGKSNLLRVLVDGFRRLYPPERLGVVVVDYRRGLLGAVPEEYLLAYCGTPQNTLAVAQEVAASVTKRLPGPEVTAEQLRRRNWWSGLEVLVVVDDYDLVANSSGNPLLPLVEFIAQSRDIGLHLVLARRTGGMSRAMLDPLIQRLNDVSTPGFLFSGDRMEGRLINGVASQRLPAGRALYATRGGGFQQIQVAVATGE